MKSGSNNNTKFDFQRTSDFKTNLKVLKEWEGKTRGKGPGPDSNPERRGQAFAYMGNTLDRWTPLSIHIYCGTAVRDHVALCMCEGRFNHVVYSALRPSRIDAALSTW